VTKGLGTVMKRTHLKISTVPKGVTYPLIIEQRILTSLIIKFLTAKNPWFPIFYLNTRSLFNKKKGCILLHMILLYVALQ